MNRKILLASLLVPFAIASARPASAADPDIDGIRKTLRDGGIALTKGCEYTKYLTLVQQFTNTYDKIKSLDRWRKVTDALLPIFDPVATIFQGLGGEAQKDQAKNSGKSLVYELEQVCNAVKQANETNRMYQIVEAGHVNTGNFIDFLKSKVNADVDIAVVDHNRRLSSNFSKTYESTLPENAFRNDSLLYGEINKTLKASLEAGDNMLTILDTLNAELKKLKKQMLLLAMPRDTTKTVGDALAASEASAADLNRIWKCPSGYEQDITKLPRDTESLPGMSASYRPICGPVGEERAIQVLAAVEVLKLQYMQVQQVADARMLEVNSVRLMVDNQKRREKDWSARSTRPF